MSSTAHSRGPGSGEPPAEDAAPEALRRRLHELEARLVDGEQTLEALRAQEARYRALVEQSSDAIVVVDAGGQVQDANSTAAVMLGYGPGEIDAMRGRPIAEFVDPEELEQDPSDVEAVRAGCTVIRRRLLVRRDGSRFPAETSTREAEPGVVQLLLRDLSERERSEAELRVLQEVAIAANEATSLEEALARCLQSVTTHLQWDVGHAFVLDPGDPAWLVSAPLWSTPDDPAQEPFRRASAALRLPAARLQVGHLFSLDQSAWIEELPEASGPERRDAALASGLRVGALVPVSIDGAVVAALELFARDARARDERLLHLVALAGEQLEPVVERERGRTALRRAHQVASHLIDSLPVLLIGLDAAGRVTHWNDDAERRTRLAAKEAIGRVFATLPLPEDLAPLVDLAARCREDRRIVSGEPLVHRRGDGRERILEVLAQPLSLDGQAEPVTVLMGKDITEIRRLEASVVTAQRLESIGQLASGIAHELNTPMQFVGDNVQFLTRAFDDLRRVLVSGVAGAPDVDLAWLLEEVPRAIRDSTDGIEQVSRIVRAMKELSNPGSGVPVPMDVNELVQSTLTVTRNSWKYLAEVETELASDLPPLPCHPGPLSRALAHLIVNAAEAIADAGGDEEAKGRIRVHTRRDGELVEIRIGDSGTGIPDAIRTRVFDPFFTTKEAGRGTGQGLAIAHSVVSEGHGGTLRFETESGVGTTFVVRLPLAHHD